MARSATVTKLETSVSAASDKSHVVIIERPKFQRADIAIVGVAPYVQHKFAQKAQAKMAEKQKLGSQARSSRKREARDFDADYKAAMHISKQDWYGIPAPCFRNAMISACRIVGFKMTLAKLSIFIEADGFDADDGMPLVRLHGEPRMHVGPVRNANGGTDLRARPMWEEWSATVRVRWDAGQFAGEDIMNLMARAGMQVGIGEGRPDSCNSYGLGWGLFEVR